MAHLCDDPDTAIGAMFVETRSGNSLHEGYSRGLQKVVARTGSRSSSSTTSPPWATTTWWSASPPRRSRC